MKLLKIIAFTVCCLLLANVAHATQRNLAVTKGGAQVQKRVALVIGNSAYKGAPALRNPVNDAKAMSNALNRLGFEVIEVTDATQKEMNRAITLFGEKLNSESAALFFYAGHGLQVRGKNYIVPVDAQIKSESAVASESVSVDTVLEQLNVSSVSIVILDACRNNPFERSFRKMGGGGLAQMDAPKGSFIAYATAPGKTAADGDGKNGLFTEELLKYINEPGLTLESVFKRVRSSVATKSNDEQMPWDSSSMTGEFFFRPVAADTVPTTLPLTVPVDAGAMELSFWDSIKNSSDAEDFQAYLNKFPNGQFAALAERRAMRRPVKVDEIAANTSAPDVFKDCAECPEMIVIPAGSFEMGGTDTQTMPIHRVDIKGYALGRTEVTQGQWRTIMGNNPSHFSNCGDSCPVEHVSWEGAQDFVRKLSQKTGKTYRLPSEAEWEYACRAGGKHTHCGGENLDSLGWPRRSMFAEVHPVADKQPNAWGLYDMSGNVWEWAQDCWNDSYGGAPSDGSAWMSGDCSEHVVRGGSSGIRQNIPSAAIRQGIGSAYRDLGFRPARMLTQPHPLDD